MNDLEQIEQLKKFVKKSFNDADKSHKCILNESIPSALAYLNKGLSELSTAESFYYCNYENLMRNEFEDYVLQFNEFANEMIECVDTDHSHQWTDIEFERLSDLMRFSPFSD